VASTEPSEIDNAVRRERRKRKNGTDKCAWCPERDPVTLEQHHVYCRATNARLTLTLCRNCHAKATAYQLDEGVSFDGPVSLVDYVENVLAAESALVRQVADIHADAIQRLAAFREALDKHHPEWRRLPEAKP
jgi:hypothetical protein